MHAAWAELPTRWQGMRDGRLDEFTTRLADSPVPSYGTAGLDSAPPPLLRSANSDPQLTSPVWYAEVTLQHVKESNPELLEAVSIGFVRLPAGGFTFALDELRAKLADTGAVSGIGALPGLVPESTAYLSTGEVLCEGQPVSLANATSSSELLLDPTPAPEGDEADFDTPLNPSDAILEASAVVPFGHLDTVGVGVELANGGSLGGNRVFFVCNGTVVSICHLGPSSEAASGEATESRLWPVLGSSAQWLTVSSNFGDKPFQWPGCVGFREAVTIVNSCERTVGRAEVLEPGTLVAEAPVEAASTAAVRSRFNLGGWLFSRESSSTSAGPAPETLPPLPPPSPERGRRSVSAEHRSPFFNAAAGVVDAEDEQLQLAVALSASVEATSLAEQENERASLLISQSGSSIDRGRDISARSIGRNSRSRSRNRSRSSSRRYMSHDRTEEDQDDIAAVTAGVTDGRASSQPQSERVSFRAATDASTDDFDDLVQVRERAAAAAVRARDVAALLTELTSAGRAPKASPHRMSRSESTMGKGQGGGKTDAPVASPATEGEGSKSSEGANVARAHPMLSNEEETLPLAHVASLSAKDAEQSLEEGKVDSSSVEAFADLNEKPLSHSTSLRDSQGSTDSSEASFGDDKSAAASDPQSEAVDQDDLRRQRRRLGTSEAEILEEVVIQGKGAEKSLATALASLLQWHAIMDDANPSSSANNQVTDAAVPTTNASVLDTAPTRLAPSAPRDGWGAIHPLHPGHRLTKSDFVSDWICDAPQGTCVGPDQCGAGHVRWRCTNDACDFDLCQPCFSAPGLTVQPPPPPPSSITSLRRDVVSSGAARVDQVGNDRLGSLVGDDGVGPWASEDQLSPAASQDSVLNEAASALALLKTSLRRAQKKLVPQPALGQSSRGTEGSNLTITAAAAEDNSSMMSSRSDGAVLMVFPETPWSASASTSTSPISRDNPSPLLSPSSFAHAASAAATAMGLSANVISDTMPKSSLSSLQSPPRPRVLQAAGDESSSAISESQVLKPEEARRRHLKKVVESVKLGTSVASRLAAVEELSILAGDGPSPACAEAANSSGGDGLRTVAKVLESPLFRRRNSFSAAGGGGSSSDDDLRSDLEAAASLCLAKLACGAENARVLIALAPTLFGALRRLLQPMKSSSPPQSPKVLPRPVTSMRSFSPKKESCEPTCSSSGGDAYTGRRTSSSSGADFMAAATSAEEGRRAAALALAHFASLLQQERASEEPGDHPDRGPLFASLVQLAVLAAKSKQPPKHHARHASSSTDSTGDSAGDDNSNNHESALEGATVVNAAFVVSTVVNLAGTCPVLSSHDAVPCLVRWLRSDNRQVVALAAGAVASLLAPDTPACAEPISKLSKSGSSGAAQTVYSSGYLDARLVNEGVAAALVALIHCSEEEPQQATTDSGIPSSPPVPMRSQSSSASEEDAATNATGGRSSTRGLVWPEVTLLAVRGLAHLCRKSAATQEEVLRAPSYNNETDGGLEALVQLLRAASLKGTSPHVRLATDACLALDALTEGAETPVDKPNLPTSLAVDGVASAESTLLAEVAIERLEEAVLHGMLPALAYLAENFSKWNAANTGSRASQGRLRSDSDGTPRDGGGKFRAMRWRSNESHEDSAPSCPSGPPKRSSSDELCTLALNLLLRVARVRRLRPYFFAKDSALTSSSYEPASISAALTYPLAVFEALLVTAHNAATMTATTPFNSDTNSSALIIAMALTATAALQLLTATASVSQAEAMVAAGAAPALLNVSALAEKVKSKSLLLQALAALSRLAPQLLPQPADSSGSSGSGATASADFFNVSLSAMEHQRSSSSLSEAAPPIPEILYSSSGWVNDSREHDRLRVLYKLLRVLKMPHPRASDYTAKKESAPSSTAADSEDNSRGVGVNKEKGGGGGSGKGDEGFVKAVPSAMPPAVPLAVAEAEHVSLQRAAVRGLAFLAVHPTVRTLVVDHCLPELVALAVGIQPLGGAAVAAVNGSGGGGGGSSNSSDVEKQAPASGPLLVRSSSLAYMPPATPAAAQMHLLVGEPELRAEALSCLVRLGFEGGARDLELCFNDAKLLAVWFHHRRSLQHQAVSRWLLAEAAALKWGFERGSTHNTGSGADGQRNVSGEHDNAHVKTVARLFASPVDIPFASALAAHCAQKKSASRSRGGPYRNDSPLTPGINSDGTDKGSAAEKSSLQQRNQAQGTGGGEPSVFSSAGQWLRSASVNAVASSQTEFIKPMPPPKKQLSEGERVRSSTNERGASDIVPLSASFLSSSQNVQLTAATIEPLSSPSSRPSLHSPPPSPPPNVTTHPTTPSSAPQSSTIAEAISSERYGTTSTPTTSSSLRVTSPVSARSPTDYRTSRSLDPSPLSSGAPRERFSPFSGFDWKAGVTAGLGKLLNCAPALAPAGVGDDSSYPRSHFSGGPAVRPMSFFGSGDNDSSIGSTPGGFTVANRTTSPSSAFENNQDAALESEFVRRHARSWQWNDNQGRMHAPLEQQQRPTRGLGAEWWAGVMAEGMAAYESHVPLDGTSSRPRDAAAAAARGVSAAVAAAGNGGGGGSSASPVQAPGRAPGHFEWFETHGDFLNTFWPSPLEQQLCIAPSRARTAWNRSFSASEGVCFPAAPPVLPRVNSRGGVAMPQRTYWSFSREARVLKKLLGGPPTGLPDSAATNIEDISPLERGSSGNSNNGGMKWALCFEDSTYHGDFTSTLHDALHRLPDVDSLSFRAGFQPSAHVGSGGQGGSGGTNSGRSFDNGGSGGVGNRRVGAAADSNTTCLAYLAQDLPLSVRHVTYDGVLSRDAVQILGVALMSRTVHQRRNSCDTSSLAAAAAYGSSGTTRDRLGSSSHNAAGSGMHLRGLAVRNHGHVRLEDFESLFEALQMGDGPEDNSEDENDDDGEYGDAVKHGDKAGVSGGSKKSVLCDSQEEEVGKEVEEEDSWADIPERVDLATCKALLAKHYPGEEMDMEAFEAFQDKDGFVSRDKLQVASHFMHKQWVKEHPSTVGGSTTPQNKANSPPPLSSKASKEGHYATTDKQVESATKQGPQPQAGLRLPPVEGLQWLDLSGHRYLGDAGAAQIATAVTLGCRALRGLDLSRLGSLGHAPLLMTALCGPLGSNGRPGLFFQTRHLEVLHLRGNALTTRAVCRLFAALTNHPPSITTTSLSNSSSRSSNNSRGSAGSTLAPTSSSLTHAMSSPLKDSDSDCPTSPPTASSSDSGSNQRWNLPRPKWPGSGDVSSSPGSSHPLLPSSSSDALVWGGINTGSRGHLKRGWRQGWRGLEELSLDENNLTTGLGLGPASSNSNNPLLSHLRGLLTRNPANGLRVLGLSNPIASLPSRAGLGESGGREIVMGLMANYATSTLHSIRLEGCGVDLESLNVIHTMLAKNRAHFASIAQAAMHRPSRASAAATKTSTTTGAAAEVAMQSPAQKSGTAAATTAITTSGRRLSDSTMQVPRGQSSGENTSISASHSPGRAWSSLTDLPQSSHEVPSSSMLPRDDANAVTPSSPHRRYQDTNFPGELAPASAGNAYGSRRDDGQEQLTRTNSGRWLSLDGQRSRRANSDPPLPSMLNAPSNWQQNGVEQGLKPEALEGMEDSMTTSTSGDAAKVRPDLLSLTGDDGSVDEGTAAGITSAKTESAPDAGVTVGNTSNDSSSLISSSSEGFEGLHFSVLFSAPLAWRDSRGTLTPIQMLDHESEKDMLAQTFREAKRPIRLDFSYATTEKLRSLVTLGCHALHFSGHGHPRCLTFEDGAGGLQAVHHERLRALVGAAGGTSGSSLSSHSSSSMQSSASASIVPGAGAMNTGGFGSPPHSQRSSSSSGPSLRFVFVSACHSHLSGQAFADAGVPHVVCVKKEAELLDSAALCFTRAFYLALAVGRTVADSFAIGREAVASSPHVEQERALAEADKFLLLPRPQGPHDRRHDVPVFGPGAEALALSRNQLPYHIRTIARPPLVGAADAARNPMPPEDFIGREVDMWRVINLLTVRRLVTVAGAPGVGKSALVAGSCQYLAARDLFKGGIIFLRLGHRTVTQSRFLELIEDALVQQSEAVQAAHRNEEQRAGATHSADSSLNPLGSSSAAGFGAGTPSPLPPLPHPRVPRAKDIAALQEQQAIQAGTDADQSGLLGAGLLGDLNRRAAREAWIVRALRDRSALLVVDHADALLRRNSNSLAPGTQGSSGGSGSTSSGGADSLEGKPLSLRLSHDATASGSLSGAADDDGNNSDDDDNSDDLDDEEEGGGLRGFLGRLFHGARHMKVLLATNASSEGGAAISASTSGSSGSSLSGGPGDHLVSAMVPLGPLSLQDAVRLFCRLSPRLRTAKERKQCLEFLAPANKGHTASSSSPFATTATPITAQQQSHNNLNAAQAREAALLAALGNGFPGHIVQLALAEASLDQLVSVAKAHPLHMALPPAVLPPPSQLPIPAPPVSNPEPMQQPQSGGAPEPSHDSSSGGSSGYSAVSHASVDATAVPPPIPTSGPNQQLEGQPLVRMQSQLLADATGGVANRGGRGRTGGGDVPH